jgi:hypothetical protein
LSNHFQLTAIKLTLASPARDHEETTYVNSSAIDQATQRMDRKGTTIVLVSGQVLEVVETPEEILGAESIGEQRYQEIADKYAEAVQVQQMGAQLIPVTIDDVAIAAEIAADADKTPAGT